MPILIIFPLQPIQVYDQQSLLTPNGTLMPSVPQGAFRQYPPSQVPPYPLQPFFIMQPPTLPHMDVPPVSISASPAAPFCTSVFYGLVSCSNTTGFLQ